jgi:hypothetical protein
MSNHAHPITIIPPKKPYLRREGLDTTFVTIGEVTLTTTTSQNLGLDNKIIRT